ncbi:hypothetical protein D9M72_654190 [compost metagenome]
MPLTMPTRPLALSRSSSGIRIVTSVGRAMLRILPAMTPSMTRNTKAQRYQPYGSVKAPSGSSSSMTSDSP